MVDRSLKEGARPRGLNGACANPDFRAPMRSMSHGPQSSPLDISALAAGHAPNPWSHDAPSRLMSPSDFPRAPEDARGSRPLRPADGRWRRASLEGSKAAARDHEVDNLVMAMSGRQRRAPRSDLTLSFDRRLRIID